ncbi:hypothetical protein JHK85_053341 [Glycine max]|nr:hypothetical protein JHK85_053341 [Glycine max]
MRKEGWFQNANAMGGSDVVAVIVDAINNTLCNWHQMATEADAPVIPLLTPYKMGNFNLSHRYSEAS